MDDERDPEDMSLLDDSLFSETCKDQQITQGSRGVPRPNQRLHCKGAAEDTHVVSRHIRLESLS